MMMAKKVIASFLTIFVLFMIYACAHVTSSSLKNADDAEQGPKGDNGVLEQKRRHRQRRNVEPTKQGTLGLSQSKVAPGYQTSYFVDQCYMCPPGPPGPPGPQGTQGISGRDGRDAVLFALATADGSPLYAQPRVQSASRPVNSNATGVTYIRWGKSTCPSTSEIVYAGVVAGSHYIHKGGGANHLCLPLDPVFDRPVAGRNGGSYLYGTEYETSTWFPPLSGLQNAAVPCTVCLAPAKVHTLMIPGTNLCPTSDKDWTLEYHGYILSEHNNHRRSEYICVDHEAEGIGRTAGNQDEAHLHIVEVTCSTNTGIPCPPYVDGYELACAVCTI